MVRSAPYSIFLVRVCCTWPNIVLNLVYHLENNVQLSTLNNVLCSLPVSKRKSNIVHTTSFTKITVHRHSTWYSEHGAWNLVPGMKNYVLFRFGNREPYGPQKNYMVPKIPCTIRFGHPPIMSKRYLNGYSSWKFLKKSVIHSAHSCFFKRKRMRGPDYKSKIINKGLTYVDKYRLNPQ